MSTPSAFAYRNGPPRVAGGGTIVQFYLIRIVIGRGAVNGCKIETGRSVRSPQLARSAKRPYCKAAENDYSATLSTQCSR